MALVGWYEHLTTKADIENLRAEFKSDFLAFQVEINRRIDRLFWAIIGIGGGLKELTNRTRTRADTRICSPGLCRSFEVLALNGLRDTLDADIADGQPRTGGLRTTDLATNISAESPWEPSTDP